MEDQLDNKNKIRSKLSLGLCAPRAVRRSHRRRAAGAVPPALSEVGMECRLAERGKNGGAYGDTHKKLAVRRAFYLQQFQEGA